MTPYRHPHPAARRSRIGSRIGSRTRRRRRRGGRRREAATAAGGNTAGTRRILDALNDRANLESSVAQRR